MFKGTIFVDGSNFLGSLSKVGIQIQIKDYETFFRYVFDESVKIWSKCLRGSSITTLMNRVYWYAVGSIDIWDFDKPETKQHLYEIFNKEKEPKKTYMTLIGKQNAGMPQNEVAEKAWDMLFKETKTWYQKRKANIDGFGNFYTGLQRSSDFIEVISCGHWKIKPLTRVILEKELDTRLAVDIVTLESIYDFALIISGDADFIPSIEYIKKRGKHVGVVELIKGFPPEKKGQQFSNRLGTVADFVVKIYEMDLVKNGIASQLTDDKVIKSYEDIE
ncbi:MAG: NYN domain-containing protein [Dehalobacter sp. 4CP]|uniref:NYN domain-containing protein n=1 Tax=Dehalobacter sp. CP TaxID=2594474 RepID=UPI0013CB58A9|nr:NYN domain-containing protein [Dehalobacter sp. 4CP]